MNSSWKLGTAFGIGIFVHWSFLLLPAAIVWMTLASGGGVPAGITSVLFILAVFGCVVLHELGHALMARHFGIGTHDITLLPIGGVARLERMPEKPSQEIAVALAGPAVNVVIAGMLFVVLLLTGAGGMFSFLGAGLSSLMVQLMWTNVALVVFNMLPAFPMDGGRVLRATLATQMPYAKATSIAASVGRVLAVGLGVLGLFTNWMLMFVAMFIFFAARGEEQFALRKASLDRLQVGDLMRRRFRVVPAEARLEDVLPLLDRTGQRDFPVVHGPRLVGMISTDEIQRRIAAGENDVLVADAMTVGATAILEHEPLGKIAAYMQSSGDTALPVVRGGELVGLLTADCLDVPLPVQDGAASPQAWPTRQTHAACGTSSVM